MSFLAEMDLSLIKIYYRFRFELKSFLFTFFIFWLNHNKFSIINKLDREVLCRHSTNNKGSNNVFKALFLKYTYVYCICLIY